MDFIRVNARSVVGLDKGDYGTRLILGYEKDGGFKPKYCESSAWEEFESTVPIAIPLGNDPIRVLEVLLGMAKREKAVAV
jgi:hypothetical protein